DASDGFCDARIRCAEQRRVQRHYRRSRRWKNDPGAPSVEEDRSENNQYRADFEYSAGQRRATAIHYGVTEFALRGKFARVAEDFPGIPLFPTRARAEDNHHRR